MDQASPARLALIRRREDAIEPSHFRVARDRGLAPLGMADRDRKRDVSFGTIN
jgi:hypothetical protein